MLRVLAFLFREFETKFRTGMAEVHVHAEAMLGNEAQWVLLYVAHCGTLAYPNCIYWNTGGDGYGFRTTSEYKKSISISFREALEPPRSGPRDGDMPCVAWYDNFYFIGSKAEDHCLQTAISHGRRELGAWGYNYAKVNPMRDDVPDKVAINGKKYGTDDLAFTILSAARYARIEPVREDLAALETFIDTNPTVFRAMFHMSYQNSRIDQ